jgi:putative transposase
MQQDAHTGERMLEILPNGVSTRRYRRVIPEMADTVGVSRSTVSRETIEASEAALKRLMDRRFDDVELLIIYIDGIHFANQCVLVAVGVDLQGRKHVLALREGATENAEGGQRFSPTPGRARRRSYAAAAFHHRWLESSAHCDQCCVWS